MAKLPVISGKEAVRIFENFGWELARQKSSHIIMVKEDNLITLSIPNHKEIAKGTLRSLIRMSGLTVSDFLEKL